MKRPDLMPTTFEGALSKIIEEMCEVGRCIAKIQQHGMVAIDRGVDPPKTYYNGIDLWGELDDLERAIRLAKRLWKVNEDNENPRTNNQDIGPV